MMSLRFATALFALLGACSQPGWKRMPPVLETARWDLDASARDLERVRTELPSLFSEADPTAIRDAIAALESRIAAARTELDQIEASSNPARLSGLILGEISAIRRDVDSLWRVAPHADGPR